VRVGLLAASLLLVIALSTSVTGCSGGTGTPTATPTLPPPPSPVPSATPVPPTATAASTSLVVGNTGGDGAWLRRSPGTGEQVKAWPDGTKMTLAGKDQQVDGKTWRNVKDPAGNTGWMLADYLVAAPAAEKPAATATPKP